MTDNDKAELLQEQEDNLKAEHVMGKHERRQENCPFCPPEPPSWADLGWT